MSRTKGAVNKKKQIKNEAKEKVEKEIKALEPEVHFPTTKCSCDHEREMHYGGIKGHCNTPNCPCLDFK